MKKTLVKKIEAINDELHKQDFIDPVFRADMIRSIALTDIADSLKEVASAIIGKSKSKIPFSEEHKVIDFQEIIEGILSKPLGPKGCKENGRYMREFTDIIIEMGFGKMASALVYGFEECENYALLHLDIKDEEGVPTQQFEVIIHKRGKKLPTAEDIEKTWDTPESFE